jgi:hypothetical protein
MEDKWIPVQNSVARIMPTEDCTVWVTRWNCWGDRWVQTIDYYVEAGYFDWAGVIAWMPLQDEKPEVYNGDKGYY